MNKTKIEWCDYTWNPITGCTNGCDYCYARKIAMRFDGHFKPTFHRDRLDQLAKLKKPSKIFVCSMGDMFDGEAKAEWGQKVLDYCYNNPKHQYFILTKQPHHIKWYNREVHEQTKNVWLGVSINKQEDLWRIDKLKDNWRGMKFLSIEPLLEDLGEINLEGISWVIIGGQTGAKKIIPKREWAMNIQTQAEERKIPVFLKNNLGR